MDIVASHYAIRPIDGTVKESLRPLFPQDVAYELNWLFLSTDGVHGTGATLDSNNELEEDEETGELGPLPWPRKITCLVVRPRTCIMLYGHLEYDPDDEAWLRSTVQATLGAVARRQAGNLPA